MDIPIRFPNDADVIAEEAARFRQLSPEARIRALGSCYQDYRFLKTASGRVTQLDQFSHEEERLSWEAIQEFVARHA